MRQGARASLRHPSGCRRPRVCDLRRNSRDRRPYLLPLKRGPVEIGVLARHPGVLNRKDVYPIANEKLPLSGGSAHLILTHEVSRSDVHPLPVETDIGPLSQRGSKRHPRRVMADRRLATTMKMKRRVVGMHLHDRVQVAMNAIQTQEGADE